MFNPERLLGSMVKGALRRRGRSIGGAALGMGLLGVAIAAVEHVAEQKRGGTSPSAGPPPPPGGMPPPPPPPAQAAPAVPPPPPPAAVPDSGDRAMLLVRAMIAAAAADGHVDDDERARIVARLEDDDDDTRLRLEREMAAPLTADEVAAACGSPERAEEVYAASLLAIRVDTDAERSYLQRLAGALSLDPTAVERLHRIFGVTR